MAQYTIKIKQVFDPKFKEGDEVTYLGKEYVVLEVIREHSTGIYMYKIESDEAFYFVYEKQLKLIEYPLTGTAALESLIEGNKLQNRKHRLDDYIQIKDGLVTYSRAGLLDRSWDININEIMMKDWRIVN